MFVPFMLTENIRSLKGDSLSILRMRNFLERNSGPISEFKAAYASLPDANQNLKDFGFQQVPTGKK